jgi:hypothetical protein
MAISPAARYPGQVDTGVAVYPYGRARNVNTPGAGDGTPFEKDLLNDIFGFQQALLVAAGLTPSGTPDHRDASQYLDAIKALTKRTAICLSVSGININEGSVFDLATDFESNASLFSVGTDGTGDYVEATQTGIYNVSLTGKILGASASDGLELELGAVSSAIVCTAGGVRYGTNPLKPVYVSGTRLMQLGGVGQRLYVANILAGGSQMHSVGVKLSVSKVTGGTQTSGW